MEKIVVKDMTCMSCVNKIQSVLLTNGIVPKIDLLKHEVIVDKKNKDKAVELIKNSGYNPEND